MKKNATIVTLLIYSYHFTLFKTRLRPLFDLPNLELHIIGVHTRVQFGNKILTMIHVLPEGVLGAGAPPHFAQVTENKPVSGK